MNDRRFQRLFILLFIFFFFISFSLKSQPNYLQFDNLINNPFTNVVSDIFQDSKGWIWFTSSQGLNKYDGFRIKSYKVSGEDSSNFIGSSGKCIFEDSKGMLWIGTENGGLYKFDREKDKFIPYFEHENGGKIRYFSALSVAEDKEGTLWIGSNEGLKKLNQSTGKYFTYTNHAYGFISPYSNHITKVKLDRKGKLLLGTNKGFDRFNIITKSFEHIDFTGASNPRPPVTDILEDNEGKLWITTFSGVYIVNPETKETKQLSVSKNYEFSNLVTAVMQAKDGKFWVATLGGLYIYSSDTKSFTHFEHDQKNPFSLCHSSLMSLFQDKQDNIWIGTRAGISCLIEEKQAFHFYDSFSKDGESLNNNGINAFWADDKNIWIATDFGGISILDKNKQVIKYLSSQKQNPQSLSSNFIRGMCDDGRGNVWICAAGGISVYNTKIGSFKKYTHNDADIASLSDNIVGNVFKDRKGNLWIGTSKGIDKYNPQTDKFIHYNKIISDRMPAWIADDAEGNLWLGVSQDVIIFNPNTNRCKKFSIHYGTISFLEDSKKRIWLTTNSKGFALLDRNTLKVKKFYEESAGLANKSVNSIIEDNQQNLWIATANGLSRFSPDQEKFKNFSKDDGTRIASYNNNSCYKLPSGELMFGGVNGFVAFDPKNIKENDYLPPVVLTDFRIFYQSVPINDSGSPLKNHISETQSIVLKHDQNFISIRYIALNYSSPNKNKYAYKLEGVDNDWNKVEEKREAIYTNLEPGDYKFSVIASNNDNQWNKVGTSLNIKIIPPFYKTWLFRITVILAIVLFITFLVRKRIQYIKNKNALLEKLVNEKTSDLQQLAIELEESQSEVMAQNEEIEKQNESLHDLNEQINKQNEELKHHATALEKKVKERTSELEVAKNKAEESDKLKSSILANMSHEIRTPMNSIVGLSNLLMQDGFSEEDKKFFTTNIKRNSDILLHLINDILDLSVIEAGKMTPHFSKVNIGNLLTDLHNIFDTDRQWLEKSHLTFTLSSLCEDVITLTDRVRLEQVLRNLLHNAFKFTEEGSIELGCKVTVMDIIIYVKDSGIGIPPDKISSIFDRFVKLQDTSVKSDFGVGLGLAISSKLISILHGKIWVESEPDRGSTFFISIPIREEV